MPHRQLKILPAQEGIKNTCLVPVRTDRAGIMSNPIHLILSATELNKLSDILRDLKKFTSTNIIKAISENDKETRKSCLPELQVGMLWIFKDAGDKNNRNKLPSLPERGRG